MILYLFFMYSSIVMIFVIANSIILVFVVFLMRQVSLFLSLGYLGFMIMLGNVIFVLGSLCILRNFG